MLKKSLFLSIGGAAGLILLVLASYMLYRGISSFALTRKSLRGAERELEAYYSREPFPSPGNVAQEQRNAAMQKEWFDSLMAALSEGQVASSERSPSIFSGELGRSRARMLAAAQSNGVEVAGDFAFGFSRYFSPGSELPAPDDVPRLTEQLQIVERICDALFRAGVTRLAGLEREVFEGAGAFAPGPGSATETGLRPVVGPSRTPDVRSAAVTLPARAEAGLIADDALYGRYAFAVDILAREAALWDVLNGFAKNDMFIAVRALRVRKDQPDVRGVPARGAESAEVLYKLDRLVSGPQLETPMQVRIELDVYKFREPENRG